MARRCPHCGEMISRLKYNCSTSGWESGTVDDGGNWDCSESEITDNDNYVYSCPDCDHELRVNSEWIEDAHPAPRTAPTDNIWIEDAHPAPRTAPTDNIWSNL
jgi:predicted RNA-binding Zn-ribbon protein involved in translation (DUF1610 family)